jgi:RNA polymerase sigma-70 factor (ECF subfamily)
LSETAAARFTPLPVTTRQERDGLQTVPSYLAIEVRDDESLIAQIGADDPEALSHLFKRFARPIRGVGRRILRDNAEADDLVQEVFLYIHRKWSLFDSTKSSARSWIFQIAYTQAFLRRRRLKSQGFYASGIADNLSEVEPRTNSGADYDQTVEGLFGRNGWRQILESLTEEQRETLRLHFFEGYSFAEIAQKLGQSYSNVRNHHYRGLEKVRKHITESVLSRR